MLEVGDSSIELEFTTIDALSGIQSVEVWARDTLLKTYDYSNSLPKNISESFFISNEDLPFYDEVYIVAKDGAGNTKNSNGFILNTNKIYTSKDMKRLSEVVNQNIESFSGKTVYLMNDIDLSEVCSNSNGTWNGVGNENYAFCGNFYGNGHTISNLYIESSKNCIGLFGQNNGKILNLTITGNIYACGQENVGGIAGLNNGTINYCNSKVNIYGSSQKCGGIVGYNTASINYCINYNNILGSNYVGGICGYNELGTIFYTGNLGKIESTKEIVGGICGYTGNLKKGENVIQYSYNLGEVIGVNYCGGICGAAFGDIDLIIALKYVYNLGNITATDGMASGIVGAGFYEYTGLKYTDAVFVVSSYNIGIVTGKTVNQILPKYNSIINCFVVSGRQNDSGYGTAREEYLFKEPYSNTSSVYRSLYLYNSSAWAIDENINNGYPCLTWQIEQ